MTMSSKTCSSADARFYEAPYCHLIVEPQNYSG